MEEQCHVEPITKTVCADDLNEARIMRLSVQGMGCISCATRVRNRLLAMDGVVSADVDWERGLALVDYVPAKTSVDALVLAVTAAVNDGHHSYQAKVIS
jgi:copper chaperone CopZ